MDKNHNNLKRKIKSSNAGKEKQAKISKGERIIFLFQNF